MLEPDAGSVLAVGANSRENAEVRAVCEQRGRRGSVGVANEECWSNDGRGLVGRSGRMLEVAMMYGPRATKRVGFFFKTLVVKTGKGRTAANLAMTLTRQHQREGESQRKGMGHEGQLRRCTEAKPAITRVRLNNPTACPIHCHPRHAELGPPRNQTGTCCLPSLVASRGGAESRGWVPQKSLLTATPEMRPSLPLSVLSNELLMSWPLSQLPSRPQRSFLVETVEDKHVL
jgi:hypothetical protein